MSPDYDDEPDCWSQIYALVLGALTTIGIAFIAVVLFIGAGMWWGKWEIKILKAQEAKQSTCGSCRLEQKK